MRVLLTLAAFALVVPAAAAPKVKPKPHTPDVTAGREFTVPWPPVEIAPPVYLCRVVRVGPAGVEVDVVNVHTIAKRLVLHIGEARCFAVDPGTQSLPTAEQVQRLIEASPETDR